MAGTLARVLGLLFGIVIFNLFPVPGQAAGVAGPSNSTTDSGSSPLKLKDDCSDHIEHQDIYEAEGSVVVDQGFIDVTAHHPIVQALPGIILATWDVRLTHPNDDIFAER